MTTVSKINQACNTHSPTNQPIGQVRALAEPNYTQIPNDLLDRWLSELTEAELKIVLYIARRTFGFHRDKVEMGMRRISNGVKDKDRGTGLHLSTISKAVDSLTKRGLVRSVAGIRGRKTYELNIAAECSEIPNSERTEIANSRVFGNSEHEERKSSSERKKTERKVASPASRLEVPTDSKIKATAKPSLNGFDDEKAKSKPSGDGEDSLLRELRDAPRSTTDQEARERTRKLIALGKETDPENALSVLDRRLRDRDGLWIEYWERAKLTTYPRKVAGGHYTQLVKTFLVDRAVASEERRMQLLMPKREELNFVHVCEDGRGCTALGELADGTVCSCGTGKLWQRMKEQSYQRRMPPSVATPASCDAAGAA